MWSDNETSRDFLNFRLIAGTAVEVILQTDERPLSLGITGSWGVGKSSMLKIIKESLKERSGQSLVFVDFNAWLYQGYDDSRAALMEIVARELVKHARSENKELQTSESFLAKVGWLRVAGMAARLGSWAATGVPPPGLLGDAYQVWKGVSSGEATAEDAAKLAESAADAAKNAGTSTGDPASPPAAIHDLREHFEKTLAQLNVRLVVFIDDLDRCLPETTIATLEAIRHFLFLKNTAFVIAADDEMIRHSVRVHFAGTNSQFDEKLVTNYFDKLIQVPLRVPPLGTQDVRAYIMLLFIENSDLTQEAKDDLRTAICTQLAQTWRGERVDRDFVEKLLKGDHGALLAKLETADRLAPLMASSANIAGNPRLIKRFLNTLSMRRSLARSLGVTVDDATFAKMLLFERCGGEQAYAKFVADINNDPDGKPRFLRPLEEAAVAGKPPPQLPPDWNAQFAADWLAMPPLLWDVDLRPVVHVSRERLQMIAPADQLSSEAAALLKAATVLKSHSPQFVGQLAKLPKRDLGSILDRLLANARQGDWTKVLPGCTDVVKAHPELGDRLAGFLKEVPGHEVKAQLIPLVSDEAWSPAVLQAWSANPTVHSTAKKAIAANLAKAN